MGVVIPVDAVRRVSGTPILQKGLFGSLFSNYAACSQFFFVCVVAQMVIVAVISDCRPWAPQSGRRICVCLAVMPGCSSLALGLVLSCTAVVQLLFSACLDTLQ